MARRRFFVDAVHRGHAQISGDDAHHLTRVLRVEAGQKFEISDNHSVYLAEVETARKDLVSFRILEPAETLAIRLHTTLFASLIKFDRFEWIVEKATELGVERIVPVETARSEKGLEQAAPKRLARWNRIGREASEQSRRALLPLIDEPISFSAALADGSDYRLVLDEAAERPVLATLPAERRASDRVAVLLGPEGGWTAGERALFTSAGWSAISLGNQILRTETAAVAALAILNAAWA